MKRIAIMQPTYLPWLGYFGMMASVDQFVLLDSVQFEKRSWQQRNRIKTPQGPQWLTVPVETKGKRGQHISEVRIDSTRDFPRSHLRALELNYAKAPYFPTYFPALSRIIHNHSIWLSELNGELIAWFKDQLSINTPILKASDIPAVGAKADLLVSICEHLSASDYLSPPGSRVYLEETSAFVRSGIQVQYFRYKHPIYCQLGEGFQPYLSIVDLLFNCGENSRDFLDSGVITDFKDGPAYNVR